MSGKYNDKTGRIVDVVMVSDDEDVLIITEKGIIIRTPASEISIFDRTAQGVRIMRTGDGKVAAIAVAPHEIEEEAKEEELPSTEVVETVAEAEETNSVEGDAE